MPAATTNLSPSTICQDTPCLIRFPAAGQKDRSKGKNAEVEGREGKNGRGSLDGKITSTLLLPSLLTIKNVVRSKLLHILARLDRKTLVGQIGKLPTHDPHFDS